MIFLGRVETRFQIDFNLIETPNEVSKVEWRNISDPELFNNGNKSLRESIKVIDKKIPYSI